MADGHFSSSPTSQELSSLPRRFRRELDYYWLNDGSDEEAESQDRLPRSPRSAAQSKVDSSIDDVASNVFPEESASQLLANTSVADTISSISKKSRPRPASDWLWGYFSVTVVPHKQFINRRSNKLEDEKEIRCQHPGCAWKTFNSVRGTSTSNMKLHLQKHGITNGITVSPPGQRTIIAAWKQSDELSHQARLERNLLRWTVTELQPFTAIERPAFRSIFADLPGVTLPLGSRHTLRRRIESEFAEYRLKLKEELAATCNTIALSLDAWTSKNSIAILAVIGHWLNQDFEYQERLLEFKEIEGAHSGENMAEMIENLLIELNLEHKLLTITADNASNNETLVSELYFNLSTKVSRTDGIVSGNRAIRFQGLDSYVRCLANVLNLIVKEILSALKSGDSKRANEACDQLRDGKGIGAHTAMARLRILALWIARIPQRKQSWKNVCRINNLPDKFIVYDVENRWNSTDQMLDDSLASKRQIEEYILLQNQIPPFSSEDWQHLQQVHKVLTKFNEFTLLVSSGTSQISLTLSIYYEFSDLLVDAAECKEEFSGLEPDIAAAVAAGLAKYQKYYTFMDDSDTYYAAVILDPRTKGGLLRKELGDDGESIVNAIKERLHNEYPSQVEPEPLYSSSQMQATLEDRMLQRVQPRREHRSDIDHYFNSEPIAVTGLATKEKGWLCSWWKAHQGEFPRMALAARDYLAIPASEVAVERVFNKGRDMLGLRRHSMSAETMRILMLMRD